MEHLKLYILWLCVVISTAKLLGPEDQKKDKDSSEDEDSTFENLVKEGKTGHEYYAELTEALSKQIKSMQDLEDVKKSTGLHKEEEEEEDEEEEGEENKERQIPLDELEFDQMEHSMKLLRESLLKHPERNWIQDSKNSDLQGNNYEAIDENPQDILDTLPPLPEEKEEELTPIMIEAKKVYDSAIAKLEQRSADLQGAILQVKYAADRGYLPAKIKLAWSYVFGEGVELDVEKAKDIFETLAEDGIADAHAGMGFLYATGIGVPISQAKALVHYTIGAVGESDFAQMALAYRLWSGVTIPSSCSKALDIYMKVANKVVSQVRLSGGPSIQRVRLMDEVDGNSPGAALDTDLIEYYQLLADKGDVQAQVGLGQLHFQGGRGVTLDLNKALHYFQQAAKAGNAVANAYLGKIYLEGGEGIKADNETALRYFKKAAESQNGVGQAGLGIMYLHGRAVPKDPSTAFKYFTMAANQGSVEGQLHLAFMYYSGIGVRRDFKLAIKFFSFAAQAGHVLALYHLAQMHAKGLGMLRSCPTAVELYKNVCERGPWASRLMLAHAAWRAADVDAAFLQYAALAERGFEVAQSNAAFLLDDGATSLFPAAERWVRALQLWARAAAQGSAGARVKLGDYHYYGRGCARDLSAAAHHYRVASDALHSAQATFNLGYMHERGLGLAQDLHLAKRCYDLAAEASPDARLPAALALARLQLYASLDNMAKYIMDSPISLLFLPGDSLSNWDLYVITVLIGVLGVVMYLRGGEQRLRDPPAN